MFNGSFRNTTPINSEKKNVPTLSLLSLTTSFFKSKGGVIIYIIHRITNNPRINGQDTIIVPIDSNNPNKQSNKTTNLTTKLCYVVTMTLPFLTDRPRQ